MKLQLGILRIASRLAPPEQRAEWLEEWSAELHYVHDHRPDAATRFALGAFCDALWLRRNQPRPRLALLDSPVSCTALLTALAGVAALLAPRMIQVPYGPAEVLFVTLISALVVPAVTTLSMGDYSGNFRVRRWGFLALKIALIWPLVYFGCLDIAALIAPQMQPHGLVIGFVAGYRWVLIDQRRRCPVCLRRLACPTRIGSSSHLLLAWFGTELICMRGHGLMHVPEIPASSYSVQRWMDLDVPAL